MMEQSSMPPRVGETIDFFNDKDCEGKNYHENQNPYTLTNERKNQYEKS